MVTNQEILSSALTKTKAITSFIRNIFTENEKAFSGNKILMQGFNAFFKTAESTIARLEKPVLSIAMVGTTSAGKSTIVNGLIGRRVAPMEKKEMSAGILTLTDAKSRNITVHPTPQAFWPTGTITDLDDEIIYDKIRGIFEKYQDHEDKAAAPVIDVTGPIEWQQDRSILGLPDNLSVEFIDLPGLKTVNDRKNFEVIKKILSKAFCVVAMDFNDVDPTRVRRLLEEVKDIVKATNNNTEFLLFALNKIDDVKSDQTTAEEKISELKGLIKDTLNLSQEKEIFPFVGQLYYLIQMAVRKDPNTFEIIDFDTEDLKKIFKDCSNFFEQQLDLQNISEEEYDFIQEIRQALRRNKEISIETIDGFYNICCRISKANSFLAEIKRRINESFSQIVIRPTLDGFNKSLVKILGDLDVYIAINKNSSVLYLISDKFGILKSKIFIEGCNNDNLYSKFSQEALEIDSIVETIEKDSEDEDTLYLISRIKKDMKKVKEIMSKREKGYIDSEIDAINSAINKIASHLSELKSSSEIISYLKSQQGNRVFNVFNGMTDVPATVKKSLISTYLDEFRTSISARKSVGEFIEKMSSKMPKGILDEFSKPYETLFELFYTTLSTFSRVSDEYRKTTKYAYSETWKKTTIDTYKCADRRVRNTLSKLTGLAFVRETNTLVDAIQKYLDSELDNILNALKENAKIQSGDISALLKNALDVSKATIQLPDELFTFSSPYSSDKTEAVYAGSKIVGYHHNSCSSDDPIHESIYEDEYTYIYDNEIGCYNRWVSGINSAELVFWSIINDWLKDQVKTYMNTIKEKIKEVTTMVDSFLDGRHKQLAEKQEDKMLVLDNLSTEVSTIRELHTKLDYLYK